MALTSALPPWHCRACTPWQERRRGKKEDTRTTSRQAPLSPLGRAIGTKDYAKQTDAKELENAQARKGDSSGNQRKGDGLGDEVVDGTVDPLMDMDRGILDLEDAVMVEGVIGPLTPIHTTDQGPASIKDGQTVWGALPRLNGLPVRTTDNERNIIGITIITSPSLRAISRRARPQVRVNNSFDASGLRGATKAVRKNMMIEMVMNMIGWSVAMQGK